MTAERSPMRVPRHLQLYGFLAGAASAAAVYFGIKPSHGLGFLAFAVVWYVVSVGVRDVAARQHPGPRALYVALVPLAAGIATGIAYAVLGNPLTSALIGLVAAPVAQWLLAHLFLRQVIEDKRYELRRRAGVV